MTPLVLDVLRDDAPIIAVNKPAGIITQGAPAGIASLGDLVKAHLKQKYNKPGNVYLGIVHRLDRPVSGVMVYSRNSKGAARLSEQFRTRSVVKVYHAIVERSPDKDEDQLVDWLIKDEQTQRARVVNEQTPGAKRAVLSYRTLQQKNGRALLEVRLETGRLHQIRVQLASRGCPIVGDVSYGATTGLDGQRTSARRSTAIALHASRLTLSHPIRHEPVTIEAPLSESWNGLMPGQTL